ncbi:MAG: hypothetical protein MJ125_03185 [Clostridia bacterium]|nr:hypothetical protein [Clostridia bacterium]
MENENYNSAPDIRDEVTENSYDDSTSVTEEKKPKTLIIALIIVGCVLVLSLIGFLIFKSSIFYKLALSDIEKNNYEAASEMIAKSNKDEAAVLSEYVDLRVDFNKHYLNMLEKFDPARINKWYEKAEKVASEYDNLPDEIRMDIDSFRCKLGIIRDSVTVYDSLRYDVKDMMQVFEEINRLVETDSEGNKISFRVKDITRKTRRWRTLCDNLNNFSSNIPDGEKVYLLSYLISEAYSECDEIDAQMQNLINNGFSETDKIKSTGQGHKSFNDVRNSNGVTLNFSNPDDYERYMYNDICKKLMEYVAEFYFTD